MKTKTQTKSGEYSKEIKRFATYLSKLLEQPYTEMTQAQRNEFTCGDGISVIQRKGECWIYHLDRNTVDWTQAFKNLNEAMTVASYFGKIHSLKIYYIPVQQNADSK